MENIINQSFDENYFDAAFVWTLRMAEYIPNKVSIPMALDEENAEAAYIRRNMLIQTSMLKRFRHKLTWVKARLHERRLASRFDAVFAVSEDDKKEIENAAPELKTRNAVHVISNGVDLSLLDYKHEERDVSRITFNGSLSYSANLDAVRYFCKEILPLIRERIPEVRLTITGSIDGLDIDDLKNINGVEFTGFVPDIKPIVASSGAVVVPMRLGGGTRLKVLEALALGVPVVATSFGAQGIRADSGRHFIIEDEPEKFAQAVISVLKDDARARDLAEHGRNLVRDYYGWDSIAEKLDAILIEIAARKGENKCASTQTAQLADQKDRTSNHT
jgi:glycosyltransferase involved in cell wall biosynthesis